MGRVLLVHESAGTRALLAQVLGQEGLRVEAVDSTWACMSRFVDEPADLVVMGLADLDETELDIIPALKKEERPPRILVTFPGPRREAAVRALGKGADGYLLEPFYRDEVVGVVRGQMAPRPAAAAEPFYALSHLASEVAHAINNPLQVVALLLAQEKVTKKDLVRAIPEQTARIEAVVRHLREFGEAPAARPERADARALAAAAGFAAEPGEAVTALVDPALYTAALRSLREAVAARRKEAEGVRGEVVAERDAVLLRVAVPLDTFAGEDPRKLLDAIFVVTPDREVRPGLARARTLLERQGGSLAVEQEGDRLLLLARVPS